MHHCLYRTIHERYVIQSFPLTTLLHRYYIYDYGLYHFRKRVCTILGRGSVPRIPQRYAGIVLQCDKKQEVEARVEVEEMATQSIWSDE